jgi:hypothetical protein
MPLTDLLQNDSGIDAPYRHLPKNVTPGDILELPGVLLKWYAVHPQDRPVPDEIARLARACLQKADLEAKGFGFVILHLCGKNFYFLIVSTWRNNNELWETVFYKDGDAMDHFAIFPREGVHKPAYCVWELVPLWHEQQAWTRFLCSGRDSAALESWRRDFYSGPA